jgi:acid phosphatase type 7
MQHQSFKLLFLFLFLAVAGAAQPVILPYGAAWKYLDNGSNQDTLWRHTDFNDSTWKSGNALLGYGTANLATTVSFGPDETRKYITTYFRKTISISNPALYASVRATVKRDDGVVVYVNGREVFRNRMPTGIITHTTKASSLGDNGSGETAFTISSSAFVTGNNVVAVEVHQYKETSSDIAFDLKLSGNALLTRGPYLQMGNQTGVTIRWRTNIPTNSRIQAGTTYGSYTLSANSSAQTTEHAVRLNGLRPGTKYYYRIGSSVQTLQSGTANYFRTAPPADSAGKTRIAVFGDCGRDENGNRTGALNAYLRRVDSNAAPIMLLLGDNAYQKGTDAEYQTQFFNPYSSTVLKNHIVFPAPGNHDYYSSTQASRSGPYYQNFTMPTAAECGGIASGTEAYYAYDWGNIHFVSMDSYGTETASNSRMYDTLSPQVTWLKRDLAANKKPWVIVYWHHPPFTMGSHNSDTETELVKIRQNFIRIIERFGVDLVLTGHSHDYERSYLLNDYYGTEADFNPLLHAKSSSSGKDDGSPNSLPYTTQLGAGNHGTVYVVTGSSGAAGNVQAGYPHNAMPFSFNEGGMFYLEVEANRLNAEFIRKDGVIRDKFTIIQDTVTGSKTLSQSKTSFVNESELSVFPTLVKRGSAVTIKAAQAKNRNIKVVDANGRVISATILNKATEINTSGYAAGTYFVLIEGFKNNAVSRFVVID